jgi:hypothetical protein
MRQKGAGRLSDSAPFNFQSSAAVIGNLEPAGRAALDRLSDPATFGDGRRFPTF